MRSLQHRRLFLITFLLSATVVCAGSLTALYTLAPQKAQSMLEAILPRAAFDAEPPAVADAGEAARDGNAPPAARLAPEKDAAPPPVAEARHAPPSPPLPAEPSRSDAVPVTPEPGLAPNRTQPKVALETDWLDVSRSGDMVRVWNFHLANRDRMEGALALSWLERSIAASEDAAGLRALRDLAGDVLTQRINSRLAALATAARRRESRADEPRAQVAEGQPMTAGAVADLAYLDQAVTREPHNADNYLRRGAAFSTRGRLDRALADYDTAIRLDGGSAAAFHERGLVRLRLGDVEKAMADLDLAIRLGANARVYRDRGTVWFSRRAFNQAIADFDAAIRLDPSFASAYLHRGLAHKQMGATESAAADFREATRLDPALADAQRAAASPSASERGRRAAMPGPSVPAN